MKTITPSLWKSSMTLSYWQVSPIRSINYVLLIKVTKQQGLANALPKLYQWLYDHKSSIYMENRIHLSFIGGVLLFPSDFEKKITQISMTPVSMPYILILYIIRMITECMVSWFEYWIPAISYYMSCLLPQVDPSWLWDNRVILRLPLNPTTLKRWRVVVQYTNNYVIWFGTLNPLTLTIIGDNSIWELLGGMNCLLPLPINMWCQTILGLGVLSPDHHHHKWHSVAKTLHKQVRTLVSVSTYTLIGMNNYHIHVIAVIAIP